MPLKVLLASMNTGGGHTALRDSFELALKKADPQGRRFNVEKIESADESNRDFYVKVVRHFRPLQSVIYRLSESQLALRLLVAKEKHMVEEARALLLEKQPDVVVSTHLIFSGALTLARNQLGSSARIVNAIPDYGRPPKGYYPRLRSIRPDRTLVMEEKALQTLARRRREGDAPLHMSGFLTRPPFSDLARSLPKDGTFSKDQRVALWHQLTQEHSQLANWNPEKPTFIFLGGSAWTEKTLPVLERLLDDPDFTARTNMIVVAGRNPDFEARMKQRLKDVSGTSLFGFVSPEVMAKLVAMADYPVLGSLAPATLHELLELRCGPLFLFHYIPGTEKPHVSFIEDNRIGLYQPDPDRMVYMLKQAAGLSPRWESVDKLILGFPTQAALIRSENRARAAAFPAFLEQVHAGSQLILPQASAHQAA